jgi:hypothetical protein
MPERRLINQTSLSSRRFFDEGLQSHFFAPVHQHDFYAVNLVDAYSAENFAQEFPTGGE